MSASTTSFAALTTVFTPPPFCTGRYAVFVGSPSPIGGNPSTDTPSSGWIDPSFTVCNPPQYTNTYPTFSPGVCPAGMAIVGSTSETASDKTIWTGACCQSGFAQMDDKYLCTSTVTAPMGFLIDPNISTADVYTTMSDLYIEHDQIAVLWEETDLSELPDSVATRYASIMGVAIPATSTTITSSAQSLGALNTASTTSTSASSAQIVGHLTTDASVKQDSSSPMQSATIQTTSSSSASTATRQVMNISSQWVLGWITIGILVTLTV